MIFALLAAGGCARKPPPAPARSAAPARPDKIVVDYRFGWYHPSSGANSLREIAAIYQRDATIVSRVNALPLEARPAAGKMIYIPPNNDVEYVRLSLAKIKANPEIVPTQPWVAPIKPAQAMLKESIATKEADAAIKTVIERKPEPVVAALPKPKPAAAHEEPAPRPAAAPAKAAKPSPAGGRFAWPVEGKVVTPFSEGWRKACHGLEIAAPFDASVSAAHGGKVLLSSEFPGYGRLILIDHGDGFATVYGYLQTLIVKEGARVEAGQRIATVGRKGSAPLFFFQVRKQGVKVDPMLYLEQR